MDLTLCEQAKQAGAIAVAGRGGAGAQLYRRAKEVMPGGTQLLSKRPEMFLPDQWPSYYQRAQGCRVWDLDDRPFVDMSYNGIGACLLGFADPVVNEAVHACVDRGSMSTLNVPAEVELAELLIDIHPWAEAVRYARSGGEAMAVAVRIARAATGRDKIAFCGYHGWHDWYLAANLAADDGLDGHLMPGLSPAGVPRSLRGTAMPFRYGKIDELRAIIQRHGSELAAIVMEPMRNCMPEPGYLEQVKAEARECGAVLIFDEITSGWRHHFGGVHKTLGVEPDMAVFAKSISNGFPMAAIIGRDAAMQAAQSSFISSTYWTEAIGPTAALATIKRMGELDLPAAVREAGVRVQKGWCMAAQKHGLDVEVVGLPALTSINFMLENDGDRKAVQTLMTQEMLDRGYLANTYFYPTLAHSADVIDGYLAAVDEVFGVLAAAINAGDIHRRLDGPVVHGGFHRLT